MVQSSTSEAAGFYSARDRLGFEQPDPPDTGSRASATEQAAHPRLPESVGPAPEARHAPPWPDHPHTAEIRDDDPRDLKDSLRQLNDSTNDAIETQVPFPTAQSLADAETILRRLFAISPSKYMVYPSPEGEMTIFDRRELGRGLAIYCSPDGKILCVISVHGYSDVRKFGSVDAVTDEKLRRAVNDMLTREGKE